MVDNVVYLGGKTTPEEKPEKRSDDAAVRSILADTLKDYRAGKLRAVVVIGIEKADALCWRVGGDFSEAEIIGALETVKINFMVSD
jgi:hypothetical protein